MGQPLWKFKTIIGRPRLFKEPEALQAACIEYFEWVEANPLEEEKVFHNSGEITRTKVNHMRAMTIGGLCIFLDINVDTWKTWRKSQDLSAVVAWADEIIREQKFSGAAADMLNASIIARDLGLREQTDTNHSGSIDLSGMSDEEIDARIAAHLAAKS